MLRTEKEQETDPYPENILIRCHHILEQFQNGQSLDYLDDFLSYNYTENWSDYSGDSSGHECRILDRQYHPKQQQKNEEQGKEGVLEIPVDGRDEYYTVVLVNDNVLEKTISNVIRGLIIFRDRPYSKSNSNHLSTSICRPNQQLSSRKLHLLFIYFFLLFVRCQIMYCGANFVSFFLTPFLFLSRFRPN